MLPGPLGKTMTVEQCVDAFVDGLAKRKRRVYVPRWVGAASWFKAVITSRVAIAACSSTCRRSCRRWTKK